MKKQSGFTLIELCVSIAIFAVLAVIAIPNMIGWRANQQLKSVGRDVFSALQYCRVEAARRGAPVAMDFDADGNGSVEGYVVWVDDGEGTALGTDGVPVGEGNELLDPNENVLFRADLPTRITIATLPFGAGNGFTRFNTRAMPRFTGDVVITNSRGNSVTIELFSGGGVEVQ